MDRVAAAQALGVSFVPSYYTARLPDGQRIPLEPWVYRAYRESKNSGRAFFDEELGKLLNTALIIYPR